jgi:16S rRNA (guanine(966)-N(2))-methyltransferase RsmD
VPLVEPRGVRLRPTSGLVREALFNILAAEVDGARVLDLFAGTGAAGIEALSRGAAAATFIESDATCARAIVQSLARTGFASAGTVVRGVLPRALAGMEGAFDIVFCDPPYGAEEAEETLIAAAPLLAPGGVVVYEHASRYNPADRLGGLSLVDRRQYGDSTLSFYRRQEEAE